MKYSIGLTVNSELKRLLDAVPSGQRSEVIRKAIRAYAPQIKSMKIELEKLEEEHRAWSKRIQEREEFVKKSSDYDTKIWPNMKLNSGFEP